MSMFLSFQEQSLIHQHLLIKQNLSLYPAAQHPYNTFTSLNHPWPRDHLPNPEQPYNQAMSTINCKSAAFYIFKSSTALTSYFLWDKKQPFQGDWQGNWHDFTKEQWNPFQGTHQSQVGILCLTILLFLLHQAEHFIKHIISRSMTSIYWQPSLQCELHSMSYLNNVRGDIIFNFQFHSQGYQYCMLRYRLPPGHVIHAA